MAHELEPRRGALRSLGGAVAVALAFGDAPACGQAAGGGDTSGGSESIADNTTVLAESTTSSADTSGGGSSGVAASTSSGAADPSSSGAASSTGDGRSCDATLPDHWIDGTACDDEPAIMVHQADANTVVLRQSLCTSFEGPFMYLLFGDDRVLLEDTGAGGIAIAATVYEVIDQWLAANGKDAIELVVVNSHAHGDHVAGNSQFEGQPNTTVVQPSVAAISEYFGISDWPEQVAQYDLGGRVIDVVPIPGHQDAHIALFDHASGWLLTGDTLYPGRLYIEDFTAYVESMGRLVGAIDPLGVCHVMGTHVEMTDVPGVDFEFGADQHPGEHPLQLGWEHLVELHDAVAAMPSPTYEVHDDFIIYPL